MKPGHFIYPRRSPSPMAWVVGLSGGWIPSPRFEHIVQSPWLQELWHGGFFWLCSSSAFCLTFSSWGTCPLSGLPISVLRQIPLFGLPLPLPIGGAITPAYSSLWGAGPASQATSPRIAWSRPPGWKFRAGNCGPTASTGGGRASRDDVDLRAVVTKLTRKPRENIDCTFFWFLRLFFFPLTFRGRS